jgi:hypothetical protein
MNTVMTYVAKNHAVVEITHPCVSLVPNAAQLIWNDVMRVIEGVDEASTAVCAQVPLAEERLLLRRFRKVKWPCHSACSVCPISSIEGHETVYNQRGRPDTRIFS